MLYILILIVFNSFSSCIALWESRFQPRFAQNTKLLKANRQNYLQFYNIRHSLKLNDDDERVPAVFYSVALWVIGSLIFMLVQIFNVAAHHGPPVWESRTLLLVVMNTQGNPPSRMNVNTLAVGQMERWEADVVEFLRHVLNSSSLVCSSAFTPWLRNVDQALSQVKDQRASRRSEGLSFMSEPQSDRTASLAWLCLFHENLWFPSVQCGNPQSWCWWLFHESYVFYKIIIQMLTRWNTWFSSQGLSSSSFTVEITFLC